MRALFTTILIILSATVLRAQDSETLADIRQELTVLHVEVQKLKRELSTTGTAGTATGGGSMLERVDAIEAELRRITAQSESLQFRIEKVVKDGTNRIGDLEFRLVELEGGDVSTLGETTTLGGDTGAETASEQTVVVTPTETPTEDAPQLAIGEESDFAAARAALEAGEFETAAAKFQTFNETYPGSPLGGKAQLAYGAALEGQEDLKGAARAYLAAFSQNPTGADAPEALFRLGRGLGRIGQTSEACVTLSEVSLRFPGGEPAQKAVAEHSRLGCQ
ncbi:tol-pal system protein YbgF [Lentibacter algarum]|uniref:tol-pal system protein YbgF n=1 Tax=Lentibacter algarum TaxID=576131 RepID=UPI001C06824B|nr:tol-pal system protein YbgF [Lentibacter algarum]MBU2980971.1 tol-pal system protein YbgF [Lentibacter algarum]